MPTETLFINICMSHALLSEVGVLNPAFVGTGVFFSVPTSLQRLHHQMETFKRQSKIRLHHSPAVKPLD